MDYSNYKFLKTKRENNSIYLYFIHIKTNQIYKINLFDF